MAFPRLLLGLYAVALFSQLLLIADAALHASSSTSRLELSKRIRVATSLRADRSGSETETEQSVKKTIKQTHRSIAVFALMENDKSGHFFAIRTLENDKNYLRLDARDRGFARLMLTTAEKRQGQIDKVIEKFSNKRKSNMKINPVDRLCQATLRLGAAQLLFMDIPSYAVLQETVEVLRMHPRITVPNTKISFVNAVLRSIDRMGKEELENTSVFDNCEPQLVQEWIKAYGHEKTTKIIEASMKQSPIYLSVNLRTGSIPNKGDGNPKIQKIAQLFIQNDDDDGNGVRILPQGSILVPNEYAGSVSSWPLYNKGDWWIQDPSATLPAIALHSALCGKDRSSVANMHVVDLCSAPGGKTMQLCSFGFGKVSAIELSPRRTRSLQENLKRLGMEEFCDIHVADGREWAPENSEEKIHGVLVDVPCSATGVGSRRPGVLRKSPDLGDLISVQRELAVHVADDLLDVGGIMVYATCSLLKQESEDQIHWLLSRTKEEGSQLETVPILPGEIPGFDDAIDENGWLRVLPGVLPGDLGSCDGFFVARLRRI